MVIFKDKQFCLTWLGFGLNVVPLIIVDAITSQDHVIKSTMSAYTDNIFINESFVSAVYVQQHILDYSLVCKNPERLRNKTNIICLQVWRENGSLWRKWGGQVLEVPNMVTLVGHSPLCGKLRLATVSKHQASVVTKRWDDEVRDAYLYHMLAETMTRVCEEDPVGGEWWMDGNEMKVSVDSSSVAKSGIRSKQKHHWRYLLVASNQWCQAY